MKVTLHIHCPDRPGIIRAVTQFFHLRGGNILYLDQHVDQEAGVFFMRLECDFAQNDPGLSMLKESIAIELAEQYHMEWDLYQEGLRPRMAIFVSKYNHCLYDLLSRFRSGELEVDIPFIISNHEDLRHIADQFDIPYHCIPVNKVNKHEAETRQLELLQSHKVDFVVLARYMQIVSPLLIGAYPNRIINIHHSFLPAFAGAKPYHAAFERGVKIIGATSHYVTEDLDAGPIIEQDVTTVSHVHTVRDFVSKGRDLEKIVLATAVKLHIAHKTMVYNNKTVIFY
ncbi:formyltetrahydrofolate deformylase [Lentiprolixibacter aurantiacus]|uniref:Formyltetrahydrofolate deformylase n=1 Tax=Lentiprolixibacter aurantiacus TaxID=2993939 RepID=A0AAE3SP74_9FLAO|nr:formyltetrahydrofolate deformylase [Lentiprolixibacter aurantiacus]MCX2720537.1 formyltetrahydrofolate deformylase [Lentiprolixibacter aurantiacus]